MRHEFDVNHLLQIMDRCREYEPGHPLGRPYMPACQIAICFARDADRQRHGGDQRSNAGAYESEDDVARYPPNGCLARSAPGWHTRLGLDQEDVSGTDRAKIREDSERDRR